MDIQPLPAEVKIHTCRNHLAAGLIYVLATLLRRWYMFRGWQQWPIAEATVEAAEVHPFRGNYFVNIGYSYPAQQFLYDGVGNKVLFWRRRSIDRACGHPRSHIFRGKGVEVRNLPCAETLAMQLLFECVVEGWLAADPQPSVRCPSALGNSGLTKHSK